MARGQGTDALVEVVDTDLGIVAESRSGHLRGLAARLIHGPSAQVEGPDEAATVAQRAGVAVGGGVAVTGTMTTVTTIG